MGEFVKIATKADVTEGNGKMVSAGGKEIALFNVGGQFHAITNTCAHRGGSLGEGFLDGAIVTCPLHSWQYDVTSGACETNPSVQLERFPIKVAGDDILVEV